jgi:hypothetical protein
MNTPVTIELSSDEALVLFEWLASADFFNALPAPQEAGRIALWKLEGKLEKLLVEPFAPNYVDIVAAARRRLVGADTNGPADSTAD